MQAYSDPKRENDPHALPNVEVFEVWQDKKSGRWHNTFSVGDSPEGSDTSYPAAGWYWWSCFPGCLPDSDPFGPFDTEAEALADAQENDDDPDPDSDDDAQAAR